MSSANARQDLVLLGGGHSHALALRMLAMGPPAATRITLISDTAFAPYSGMLPGLVAGHYQYRETHIDLRRFCGQRGVRFMEAAATGIDLSRGRVLLQDRPPLSYDVLSINIGAQPELDSVPGAREHAVPVKPVSRFYRRWQELEQRLAGGGSGEAIVLVGGGAGSVELALAMRFRLGSDRQVLLLCGDTLLPGYNGPARGAVRRRLDEWGIEIREHCRVSSVAADCVQTSQGQTLGFAELVWCTGVVPADWLQNSGLPCDDRGFLSVDECLRLVGQDRVFAAGDCAVQSGSARPRAGVFAVRQAPVLAHNLRAVIEEQRLRQYRPQRRFLSLLSLGNTEAVADRGPFFASGAWVWRWKDRIDRRFMEQFREPAPPMPAPRDDSGPIHCGGCGAKLPASLLRDVLAELAREHPSAVVVEDLQEDAAILSWARDANLVQSVDSLRSLVDDPWQMGRIAALHGFSDLYAMGARPHSAQVHICLPYGAQRLQRREFYQLMSGLLREIELAGATLVGGHSMEGAELTVGVTVNGALVEDRLPTQAAGPGQRLVLSKPLGVGVVFAGAMTGQSPGDALSGAIESMLRSNRDAAELAREFAATACTDVTGFGLLGHLLEMLPEQGTQAVLYRDQIPVLPGAIELTRSGVRSTLYPGNLASLPYSLVELAEAEPLLCDPQTSGGLLMALSPGHANDLVAALNARGHTAAVIGELRARGSGAAVQFAG